MALVALQLHRDTEAAKEISHQGVGYCRHFLVGNGIYFWPLCEIIHGDQEISVSFVTVRERPSNVDCDPLERCPDVILVHQPPAFGSWPSACGTGVTLFTEPLVVS